MKKLIYSLLLIIALANNSFAAGSSGGDGGESVAKVSNYANYSVSHFVVQLCKLGYHFLISI
mgnify:CR=1 FL=1